MIVDPAIREDISPVGGCHRPRPVFLQHPLDAANQSGPNLQEDRPASSADTEQAADRAARSDLQQKHTPLVVLCLIVLRLFRYATHAASAIDPALAATRRGNWGTLGIGSALRHCSS